MSGVEYDPVIRSFMDQQKGLTDRRKEAQPAVHKITMELPVMNWTEVFNDFLAQKIGVMKIP
eukprot:3245938-Ditylum_brightwellii.AAC.1